MLGFRLDSTRLRIYLFLLLLLWGNSFSQLLRDTVRVGGRYQVEVTIKDPVLSEGDNLVPLYDQEFALLFNEDSSVTKVWHLSDDTKFFASGDEFKTPSSPEEPDTSAIPDGNGLLACKDGWRCFMLSNLDEEMVKVSIKDEDEQVNTFAELYFYYPRLVFSDEKGEKIDKLSDINFKTGEYKLINVQATTPNGKPDNTFTSTGGSNWLVPDVGDNTNLEFFIVDNNGNKSDKIDSIKITEGKAQFYMGASAPVNGAKIDFHFAMYSQLLKPSERPRDTVPFPGEININYGDYPLLDSAHIYDLDGDGIGDHIQAWFNEGLEHSPRDPQMSWPHGEKLSSVNPGGASIGFAKGNNYIEVDVEQRTVKNPPAQGDFAVEVQSESGQWFPTQTPIKDKIGPVLNGVTIIRGNDGDPDTLVALFNKELDDSFSQGKAFLVNGNSVRVSGKPVEGRVWRFIVDERDAEKVNPGDSINISANGGLKTHDQNLPASNNRKVVIREAGNIPPLTEDGNGFFDSNLDGRLDSITLEFTEALQEWQLDSLDVRFFWKDTADKIIELKPDPKDLQWDSKNPTQISWKFDPDDYGIQHNLTSIDNPSYGYGFLINKQEILEDVLYDTSTVKMTDRMAPVLTTAMIWPNSKNQNKGDSLVLYFSEEVDTNALKTLDFLEFLQTGSGSGDLGLAKAIWSDSGKVLSVQLAQGTSLWDRPNPGDSLFVKSLSHGLQDTQGNAMESDGNAVLLQGGARILSDDAFIVGVNRMAIGNDDIPRDKDGNPEAISVDFLPDNVKLDDGLRGSSLGVLLDVGMATVGDLDSISEELALDYEKIKLSWQLDIFTSLGGFVASSKGEINCTDPEFSVTGDQAGNCFENRRRVYLSWNMLAENGRKVGYGVYAAKLTVKVSGAKKTHRVVKTYAWGVKAGNGSGRPTLLRN
ncbi:MAG: hypothetical protein GX801_09445 [Fibrobacter sp.]|nr:hypothetical protein [Fibrobacter sp.]